MDYVDFKGRTHLLGKPPNWKEERGPCGTLPVRVEVHAGVPEFHSYWLPNEVELANLLAGQAIRLTIIGNSHPPVSVAVEGVPK